MRYRKCCKEKRESKRKEGKNKLLTEHISPFSYPGQPAGQTSYPGQIAQPTSGGQKAMPICRILSVSNSAS